LIEVMVVLVIMSIMALMSWQGIQTMLKTREISLGLVSAVDSIQTASAQWRVDLDNTLSAPASAQVPSLDWDARVLRLVRRSSGPGPWDPMAGGNSGDSGSNRADKRHTGHCGKLRRSEGDGLAPSAGNADAADIRCVGSRCADGQRGRSARVPSGQNIDVEIDNLSACGDIQRTRYAAGAVLRKRDKLGQSCKALIRPIRLTSLKIA
jgi:hypothetical protein